VLRAIGSVLKATVRQNDLCARFAGDEFVVVLWDCPPEHEARRVQELQTAVAAYPFEPRPGVRLSLSISAGPARFPNDGHTFDELLAAADERMYRDKAVRRSRNVARHSAAVAKPEPA
jgi:diguanylate cyclase (GGDEF)-like protein